MPRIPIKEARTTKYCPKCGKLVGWDGIKYIEHYSWCPNYGFMPENETVEQMPKKKPLYPHVPEKRKPIYPHVSKSREDKGWVYAKVGTTEVRGRKVPTGIDIEQVSPSFNQDDFDQAVRIIEKKLKVLGD